MPEIQALVLDTFPGQNTFPLSKENEKKLLERILRYAYNTSYDFGPKDMGIGPNGQIVLFDLDCFSLFGSPQSTRRILQEMGSDVPQDTARGQEGVFDRIRRSGDWIMWFDGEGRFNHLATLQDGFGYPFAPQVLSCTPREP